MSGGSGAAPSVGPGSHGRLTARPEPRHHDEGEESSVTPNILVRIAQQRRERLAREGYWLSCAEPDGDSPAARRSAGPVRFVPTGGVICEIKRRSPSRGDISASLDPVQQAALYRERGADAVSVLTEEDHFGGSLADLMDVKERFPELPALRKDFLLDVEDVRVSARAGADAVLLIAALLEPGQLAEMHAAAGELGMAALVEVHDEAEVEMVAALRPPLVGINARDLTSFRVDPLTPLRVRPAIDWPARVIYESGIFEAEQAAVAARAGFDTVLVGEAVVRDPERIGRIREGLGGVPVAGGAPGRGRIPAAGGTRSHNGVAGRQFWPAVAARLHRGLPLVKICGITNYADAAEAVRLGADLLGFVFADSPRRAAPQVVRECASLDCLKVAVVVSEAVADRGSPRAERRGEAATDESWPGEPATGGGSTAHRLPEGVTELLADGVLDAVQFHGEEAPEECAALAFPYYKALRLRTSAEVERIDAYRCPRVLVDAFSHGARGGTGKRLEPAIVEAVGERTAVWLAGGLNPENVREAITRFRPELVDASSGLEAEPGRKDHAGLAGFFNEVRYARDL